MRGKDKTKRENKGYKIRGLEYRLKKQKEMYENRINNLKDKHAIFVHSLKNVIQIDYELNCTEFMILIRIERKRVIKELEEQESYIN